MDYIISDKVIYKDIKGVPKSVPSATLRSLFYVSGNIGTIGIADNDAKGQHGGTMYYVVAEFDMFEDGVAIACQRKVYFRITDKPEDVHSAAKEAYKIMRANLVVG